jgi:hypothetical protein
MSPFPILHLCYVTKLSPSETLQRLQRHIRNDRLGVRGLFIGKIEGNNFWIRKPLVFSQRRLRPIISGEIIQLGNSTKINFTIKYTMPVMVFFSIWLVGIGFGFLGLTVKALLTLEQLWIPLIPAGVFLFGLAIIRWGIKEEAREALESLRKPLELEGLSPYITLS